MGAMNELTSQVDAMNNSSELVLNTVIKAIRAIYPAWRTSIKSQAELDSLKAEWLIAFKENRISTSEQIQRGLGRCRKDTQPFLPSVGQFIEYCKKPHASHREFDEDRLLSHDVASLTVERVRAISSKPQSELPPIPGYEHLQGGAA